MTTDHEAKLAQRIEVLTETTERLAARVEALERAIQHNPPVESPLIEQVEPVSPEPQTTAERVAARRGPGMAGLIGRTFIALGGAFFLRAFTEGEYIGRAAGVALGLAYALLWVVMADREGRRGRKRSATLHHLTASLIGYPLLWESSASFDILSPWLAASVLAIYATIEIVVAGRRACRPALWVTGVASTLSALGLLLTQQALLPFIMSMFVVALGLFWAGDRNGWRGIPWPVAMIANLVAVLMTLIVVVGDTPHWLSATQVQMALLGVVGLSVARLAAARYAKRQAGPLDVIQTLAACFIGYGGLSAIANTGNTGWIFGVGGLVAGAVCYAASIVMASKGAEQRTDYHLGLWVGAIFLGLGSLVAVSHSVAGSILAGAALLTAWFGQRQGLRAFRLQALAFALAGLLLSGLGSDFLAGFLRAATRSIPQLEPSAWVTMVALGVTFAVLRIRRPDEMPKLIGPWIESSFLLLFLLGLSAALVANLAGPIADVGTSSADSGALAVLRTGILSALAVGICLLARRPGWAHVRQVVLPILIVMGLKFVFEDLRKGSTETLVLSFVLFGVAMIVAAKTDPRRDEEEKEGEMTVETTDDSDD